LPPLTINFAVNETKVTFDLGKLTYLGDPGDTLYVTIVEDKAFAEILADGDTYKLIVNLSLGGTLKNTYERKV